MRNSSESKWLLHVTTSLTPCFIIPHVTCTFLFCLKLYFVSQDPPIEQAGEPWKGATMTAADRPTENRCYNKLLSETLLELVEACAIDRSNEGREVE
jgi:hypothetical protein